MFSFIHLPLPEAFRRKCDVTLCINNERQDGSSWDDRFFLCSQPYYTGFWGGAKLTETPRSFIEAYEASLCFIAVELSFSLKISILK